MKTHSSIHKLYTVAFGAFTNKARELGVTLKQLVKQSDYSGKVLRRGTPGAFGYDLRPKKSAKTNRIGYKVAGNSRDRRFALRHPHHFRKA
jgi:hypothetical protein